MTSPSKTPGRTVRCPFCLAQVQVPSSPEPTDTLTCESCKRGFPSSKALPFRNSPPDPKLRRRSARNRFGPLLLGVLVVGGAGAAVWAYREELLAASGARKPSEPSSKRAQDDIDLNAAKPPAETHVVQYAGTLVQTDRGLQLVPVTVPSSARQGDAACDATEKSAFAWELERGDDEPKLRIPVSVVRSTPDAIWGERLTELPKAVDHERLTACRLEIDEESDTWRKPRVAASRPAACSCTGLR